MYKFTNCAVAQIQNLVNICHGHAAVNGLNSVGCHQPLLGWFLVHDEGDDTGKVLNSMIGLKHVYSLPNLITELP